MGEPALGTVEQVFETARSFDGTPYLWGGISPFGIDCSGFTYTVLRSHGIHAPFVGRPVCIETLQEINIKRDYAGAVRPRYAEA